MPHFGGQTAIVAKVGAEIFGAADVMNRIGVSEFNNVFEYLKRNIDIK